MRQGDLRPRTGIQLSLPFDRHPVPTGAVTAPEGYRGLSAFHKYWGKKPLECLGFLIEHLTQDQDLILDPFLGSGLLAREAAIRGRRFLGVDINPISIELANLNVDLPAYADLKKAIDALQKAAKSKIEDSYARADGEIATHCIWDDSNLKAVWIAGRRGRRREETPPTPHDVRQAATYATYTSRYLRGINLYHNSRINARPTLTLSDLFSGRALRNIDLLLDFISAQTEEIRRALTLILTASCGQMSQMVFAVSGRGKTKGTSSDRIEVGSWVIGYWRPAIHFEVNVWNCFANKARRLLNACRELAQVRSFPTSQRLQDVLSQASMVALINDDAKRILKQLPDGCVQLVLTDPPHGDRLPYLELSEMWNAFLNRSVDFSEEIVVSNARERGKDMATYCKDMRQILTEVFRVLAPGGYLSIVFNARQPDSWSYLAEATRSTPSITYRGCFPLEYSAASVVQDNRKGALRSDYVLLYQKSAPGDCANILPQDIGLLPGWCTAFPKTGA